jgi:CheY-like chemotaxis protein
MDIQMPIMDGFEATKIIKEIDNNIPIIALSANVMRSDIEKTLNGGMLEHLNKPIDVNKLYTILLKYIPKKIEKQTFNSQNESENQSKKEVYIPSFKNIDTKIGLTHMRLNKNLYLKTLQNFYKEFNNIELQEFDHNTLILKLHTIKGLSASIGAMKLFEIVNQFEFSSDKNVLFLVDKELKKVLVELEKLTKEERYNKIEKIKITKGTRNELFINLKDAILKRRPRNIEYIIGKIEVFELNDVDTIAFREIKKAVESYDYSKALSTIDIYQ